jgi:predicted deacylase
MRAHDYRYLIQRWRTVARAAGLKLRPFAQTRDGVDVFHLVTPTLAPVGGMYLSAAIHGDEPASSEALITWAERHARELPRLPLMIFPCLNPSGLVLNTRANEDGIDLNRVFHNDASPVIVALRDLLVGHRFACALMLHEDFDGQGLYLYEVLRKRPYMGEALLAAASGHIAIDLRAKIESRKALRGVIRRRFDAKRFARMGYPEAIYLHLHHADHALTIETPSEFAMEQRVAAHVAIIEECVRRTLGGKSA